MPLNSLFPSGTTSEQNLVESLIIESIRQYGKEFYYIPRKFVALDELFGEDPLSKFQNAYQIEGYLDNVDSFGGQGTFMSKFGMFIEEQGQITIARTRWDNLVGRFGQTVLPNRPTEGDLIYFPMSKGLFEIKYVEHQNPFYQLGRLYVYKLKVELMQYSSERIETDIQEINQIALDMTFDVLNTEQVVPYNTNDYLTPEYTQEFANGEAAPARRDFFDNPKIKEEASGILNLDENNPFGE